MTLCSTGSLSICGTAGINRSISTEVSTGSGSLSDLSVSAGKGAPHSMLEFYGFTVTGTISVNCNCVTFDCYGTGMPSFVIVTTTPTANYYELYCKPSWVIYCQNINSVCLSANSLSTGSRSGTVILNHCVDCTETASIDVYQTGGPL